jgi:hypothetical protein
MRVRIGDYWLAGDPTKAERDHSQTGNLVFTPVRLSQQVEGLRWNQSAGYDRDNAQWHVDFQTVRRFDTYDALDTFITGYMSAHAWTGTVTFRRDLGGGEWKEWNLTEAVLSPPALIPMGLSLPIRYSMRGKTYVAGNTGSSTSILDQSGAGILDQSGEHIQQQ